MREAIDISSIIAERIQRIQLEAYRLSYDVIVFDLAVQLKCQNCSSYGSNFRCPPHTPTFYQSRKMLAQYRDFLLLMYRMPLLPVMKQMKEKHSMSGIKLLSFSQIYGDRVSYWKFSGSLLQVIELLEKLKLNFCVFGPGGGCRLCRKCGLLQNQHCRHPKKSMPSLESYGIDVYTTLKRKNIPIEIPPRTECTRVGMIATKEAEVFSFGQIGQHKISRFKWFGKIIPEIEGKIVDEVLIDCSSIHDFCVNCKYNESFLCNRNFAPWNEISSWLGGKRLIVIQFRSIQELRDNLWKWCDKYHRLGYWWALSCANFHCDICADLKPEISIRCSRNGCKLSRQGRYGNKRAWRCVKYFGILPPTKYYSKNNFGYLIF